jgi:hypothetical protein
VRLNLYIISWFCSYVEQIIILCVYLLYYPIIKVYNMIILISIIDLLMSTCYKIIIISIISDIDYKGHSRKIRVTLCSN